MKYMLLIALGLLMGSAVGSDWLGTPAYASPYNYPYSMYPAYDWTYSYPSAGYNAYVPYYTDYSAYTPVYYGSFLTPYARFKWWPSHEDLGKTLSIAQTRSSMRVFRGGYWTTPSI